MSKLWGSRFKSGTDQLADQFSYSISYDYKLALYDVIGSIAHARMLGKQKIISASDSSKIIKGLRQIQKRIEQGRFVYDPEQEDIHSQIQTELRKIAGSAADKLHTARSRNDLIALDMKLYCREEIIHTGAILEVLQEALVKCAERNKDMIIPAYTHLQSAQLVYASHHLLAYVEMLERDKGRLADCAVRLNQMPLGSGALSGTSLPIDRMAVAKELAFPEITRNSMDSVSDRDFVVELLSDLALIGMHFSRIAEDMIIWASSEFRFVDIDWSLCTGSSIMPHKKNPDILELIRGETGTLYGNLNRVLVLMKGLPLTYNRDMQLDKPALFESVEKVQLMARLLIKLFDALQFNEDVIQRRIIGDESFYSVDLMEHLIRNGVSYRDAHDTIGRIVKECLDKGRAISAMSLKELKSFHKNFQPQALAILKPEISANLKISQGSGSAASVKRQIRFWKKQFR